MTFLKRYLIPRLIQYFLVIWLGITLVFLIPRLTPNDPVMAMIGVMRARGSTLEPGAMDGIIHDLTEMYGLEGSWLDQYWAFWGRLFRADFGVSFFQFPTRVNHLIATAMPWTLGLLLTTTAISWTLGNLLGGMGGYFSRKPWSRTMDVVAMLIRPQPYYIFAFALILTFAYAVRWFPITGRAQLGAIPVWKWSYIKDVLWHAVLPAMVDTLPERLQLLPVKRQFFPLVGLVHQFLSIFPVVSPQMNRYPLRPDMRPVKNSPGITLMT